MTSVQLGAAGSLQLAAHLGATGTAWLRLTAGACLILLIARPPLRSLQCRDLPAVLGLGFATAVMTTGFLAALERIPLGTAVAIEFLGPLSVAALAARTRLALCWPALALAGVLLLAQPWNGRVDLIGVCIAAVSAVAWGAYVVLTQRVGDRFTGVQGLAISVPIAAIISAAVGLPQVVGEVAAPLLAAAIGLGILSPLLPCVLEMLALRRMTPTAFGTLMAVEPAIGLTVGAVVLQQHPNFLQIVGIACVVTAGAAAAYQGQRIAPHG